MTADLIGLRTGCPAFRHDTSSAYKKNGCRCPAALQAERNRKAKYERNRVRDTRLEPGRLARCTKPGVPPFHTDPYRNCANLPDPDLMFAENAPGIREAKAVCAGCPFRGPCADWALDTGQVYGVYGGVSAGERRPEIYRRHLTEVSS